MGGQQNLDWDRLDSRFEILAADMPTCQSGAGRDKSDSEGDQKMHPPPFKCSWPAMKSDRNLGMKKVGFGSSLLRCPSHNYV